MKNTHELEIVKRLTGASDERISVNEVGWTSRVYIVNGGEFVFKFPRSKKHKEECRHEANVFKLLSKYEFCVGVPRLNWETEDDEYFGYFGVQGTSLAEVFPTLDDRQKEDIGRQLGEFLRQLHGITDYGKMEAQTTSQRTQECLELYQDGRGKLAEFFDEAEIKAIDEFFANSVPKCMHGVGEYVFSHGDLGDNNILIDSENRVGVIDFGDAGLYDITQDFRGIEDEVVLSAMMVAYGRGEILSRQAAEDTAKMIDVLVLLHYVKENDPSVADRVERIRKRFFTRKETKS